MAELPEIAKLAGQKTYDVKVVMAKRIKIYLYLYIYTFTQKKTFIRIKREGISYLIIKLLEPPAAHHHFLCLHM